MDKIMGVVTREKQFAERLCDYVNRKNNLILTAVPFDDMASCVRFSESHPLELLLADAGMLQEGRSVEYGGRTVSLRAGRTILLDDGSGSPSLTEKRAGGASGIIWKYQPAESLIRCILENCQGVELRKTAAAVGRPVRIIGVYSPADKSAGTAFSLALCKILSQSLQVLYINFGEFSGMGILTGERFETGISDAFYHMKQGSLTPDRVHTMVYSYEGIDYIPPVRFAEDRTAIRGEDYGAMIGLILKSTAYEAAVIEMQNFAGEASDVMDSCDTVFLPVSSGRISKMQADEFCEYLRLSHRDTLLQKLVRVPLPETMTAASMGSCIDSLVYGPLGDTVRELEVVKAV